MTQPCNTPSERDGSILGCCSCTAMQLCVAALAVFSCRWFKAHLLLVGAPLAVARVEGSSQASAVIQRRSPLRALEFNNVAATPLNLGHLIFNTLNMAAHGTVLTRVHTRPNTAGRF